jgi:dihydroorotate dehydrogenase
MLSDSLLQKLREDHERFRAGIPPDIETYVLETYGFSLESSYGAHKIKNPFGKASGQLSLNTQQVSHDAEAGLGFVVLKTLIAEDEAGGQSMKAWAIPEARMKVERIQAKRADAPEPEGWTVTWRGRGWSESMDAYLAFFGEALSIGHPANMLIAPSCKYHLPQPGENVWRQSEYDYTTKKLLDVWNRHHDSAMPIEKDFSPTLAGDEHFSKQKAQILDWLKQVPVRIRKAAPNKPIAIGLKLFNAQFEDAFQIEMLEAVWNADDESRPDFVIYGNRLFDSEKEFEGKRGVAYGGPDLSGRNLTVLRQWSHTDRMPISATGDILTGRKAVEYLKCGASSFQMHTVFQLPDREYAMTVGTRTARALHRLLFDPENGFVRAVLELKGERGWEDGISIFEMTRR